jgi:serine acetyltransferase
VSWCSNDTPHVILGQFVTLNVYDATERTARSAVLGTNPNGETPPGTAAGAFLQWTHVYALVGHDSVLGDGCMLNAHTDVTGGCRLGEGVFMGSHAAAWPRAVVGDYAGIGGGSVVLRRVRPHSTVMGAPAKQIAGFAS